MAIDSTNALLPLSRFIRTGDHIYISGQVPFGQDGKLIAGDVGAQTEQVLDNLQGALAAAGASLSDVVKTTVFLSNIKRDFQRMNVVYAQRFGDHRPTRSTIGAELAVDALVEIEAIAVLRSR